MKFTLEIELGNDAMRKYADIARQLKKLSSNWNEYSYAPSKMDYAAIMDANGNKVGHWEITD